MYEIMSYCDAMRSTYTPKICSTLANLVCKANVTVTVLGRYPSVFIQSILILDFMINSVAMMQKTKSINRPFEMGNKLHIINHNTLSLLYVQIAPQASDGPTHCSKSCKIVISSGGCDLRLGKKKGESIS